MREITGGRTWLVGLLIVPALLAFLLLDAGFGLLFGMLTAAALIIIAVRSTGEGPIEIAEPGPGVMGGVLVVVTAAIEDPRTAAAVAVLVEGGQGTEPERILVLAPARTTRLHRWADDLDAARFEAQRVLTVSIATLAAAGLHADGRVGDGDLLQAAEDALRTYAATEVVVIAAEGEVEGRIAKLRDRLGRPLRRIVVEPRRSGRRR